MPSPMICRRIGCRPAAGLFKPAGIPASALEEIHLTLDELEALRLADLEGLYHETGFGENGSLPPDLRQHPGVRPPQVGGVAWSTAGR